MNPFIIAHSPDSDDAYMMAPLALGWLRGDPDMEGFAFEFVRKDIETLNHEAMDGRYAVTAISFGAYPLLRDLYQLLPSGSSIQDGTGPLLVGRTSLSPADLASVTIAVPGLRTSAFLTLRHYLTHLGLPLKFDVVPFDDILPSVKAGRFEAGLLIHESQLMYQAAGLKLAVDLGAWWQSCYQLPLPMGGNAIQKQLPLDIKQRFARLMKKSVQLARARHEESLDYAQSFGRGMDREMVSRYVKAWVNDFTEDPGEKGRRAVEKLLGMPVSWVGMGE